MFKIESYVTPILLSYVDKYVRDFKPADAQVSLWGGGVALHNLVIKADVLQQEVALPFTLVSGRIHELLIQVPWTKIMSEPIVVTIDTIECVLSLNPPAPPDGTPPSPSAPPSRSAQVMEAPPGYMQALVRRIVSNIALRVHHLIVKYVQDDIVLSLNVKHLAVDSAGANWEPTFADIDQVHPLIRRLVRLDDLTLCLDKSDADGKIRFFQEPLLYRCQLDLRVLTRLISATTRRATSLNVQLRSSKLAWSVSNEQVVLLLRLLKERPMTSNAPAPPKQTVTPAPPHTSSANSAEPTRSESWSEWAWSWLPSLADRERGVEEAPVPATALPVCFNAYLDDVSLVFKIMEVEGVNRKRSRCVLEVCAMYAALKSSVCIPTFQRFRFGARELTVRSSGKCVCGYVNYNTSKFQPTVFLQKASKPEKSEEEPWTWPEQFLNEKVVGTGVAVEENSSATPTEQTPAQSSVTAGDTGQSTTEICIAMSEKPIPDQPDGDDVDELWANMAPLVYIEYVHERSAPNPLTNPYDNPPKDFEYSDWVEECIISIVVEPVNVRVCMGLVHRLMALTNIYKEQAPPAPDLPKRTLTVEENDSLNENLPQRRIKLEVRNLRVRLLPWSHSLSERPAPPLLLLEVELPISNVVVTSPMYPHRVCSAACQLPTDAGSLWQCARRHISINTTALQVRLANSDGTETRPCARADIKLVTHELLHKAFFEKRNSIEFAYRLKIKELSICGSSARLQAALEVPISLLRQRRSLPLKHTTLRQDALNDEDSVAIDVTLEAFSMHGWITDNVNAHVVSMKSAKVTALQEPIDGEIKQAWLLSAPDEPTSSHYLRMAIQWCTEPIDTSFDYCGIWTEPLAMSVDPLLISWLAYKPTMKPAYFETRGSMSALGKGISSETINFRRRSTPPSSSGRGGTRSSVPGTELVHLRARSHGSSSEPSDKKEVKMHPMPKPQQPRDTWLSAERLTALHHRLRSMLINVELGLALLYVTMSTASAIDCVTLRDAMERHAAGSHRVVGICLGRLSVKSKFMMKELWAQLRQDGPTYVVEKLKEESFPWKIKLEDVSCYTLELRVTASHLMEAEHTGASRGFKSKLKIPMLATPRTVLELVTTTITVSVVTKSLQYKTISKKDQRAQKTKITAEDKKENYFKTGLDFKPTTLKEFVRGPSVRINKSPDEPGASSSAQPKEISPEQVKITEGPMVSLGIHLHADTPPIVIRLERDQVLTVDAAIHCFTHIVTLLNRPLLVPPKTDEGSSKSLIRSVSEIEEIPSVSEDTSEHSEIMTIFDRSRQNQRELKTFFWFQWVVSHVALVVASETVKLALDIDDVIGTVDVQSEYNQFKIKLASASIKYFKRDLDDEWTAGVMGGRVLEAREPSNSKEDAHFLSITITQAHVSDLPPSWKEELHPKLLEKTPGVDYMWEVFATLAPLEAVVQPNIVDNLMSLAREMAPRSSCPLSSETASSAPDWQWPYIYLNAGGIRLLVIGEETEKETISDDTIIFSVGKIAINPHPDNPVCRHAISTSPENGWLGASGGFEGRQYEFIVKSVSVQSSSFKTITLAEAAGAESKKATGTENPALKWSQRVNMPLMVPILHSVELSCIFAPGLYLGGVLTCGPVVELNLVSDCSIEFSIAQYLLLRQLSADFYEAMDEPSWNNTICSDGKTFDKHDVCPYAVFIQPKYNLLSATTAFDDANMDSGLMASDSGVETIASSSRTKLTDDLPMKRTTVVFVETGSASQFLEVFVTMGVIDLTLCVADDDSPEVAGLRPPTKDVVQPSVPALAPVATKESSRQKQRTAKTRKQEKAQTDSLSQESNRSLTELQRDADHGRFTQLDLQMQAKRQTTDTLPLLHVTLFQPNVYFWRRKTEKTLQLSLFDAWLALGSAAEGQWHAVLLSTAKGEPDPVTEIPPALASFKLLTPTNSGVAPSNSSSRGSMRLDIERPVQLNVSTDKLLRLISIIRLFKRNIMPTFTLTREPQDPFLYKLKNKLINEGVENVTIHTGQISVCGHEGVLGWDSLSLQGCTNARPERLDGRCLISALLVTAGPPGDTRHVVLQPLMLGMEGEAYWEAWRRVEGGLSAREPTVKICVELDNVTMDLRPSELATLNRLRSECKDLLAKRRHSISVPTGIPGTMYKKRQPGTSAAPGLPLDIFELETSQQESQQELQQDSLQDSLQESLQESPPPLSFSSPLFPSELDNSDHFYQDDLRSGAFKILSGGQLPMAYQVMLCGDAVSWRYPHPRAITRIVAFPLPGQDKEIDCVLELYSSILGRWEPHTYFKLPVGEPREHQLFVTPPETVFAVLWRFRACLDPEPVPPPYEFVMKNFLPKQDPLATEEPQEPHSVKASSEVTAEQLSGVLRVDSYFAPRLLPRTKALLRVATLHVHVHNSLPTFTSNATYLEGYYLSKPLKRTHRVLTLAARNTAVHALVGSPAGKLLVVDTNLSCDMVDCSTGTMEDIIEEFRLQSGISVKESLLTARSRLVTTGIQMSIQVPKLQTLHTLVTDWNIAYDEYIRKPPLKYETKRLDTTNKSTQEVAKAAADALAGRVLLWIHNSCSSTLNLGQEETEEAVSLGSGGCLAYRWYYPTAPKRLRFTLAGPSADWKWSNSVPFIAGTYRLKFVTQDTEYDKQFPMGAFLHVRVKEIGASQHMHLSGRLVLANMLRSTLLYKVRSHGLDTPQWYTVSSGELHAESVGRSVVCSAECEMVLKIKFRSHNTCWSGDIPLKECPKENVPWLVKVPTEGESHFVSVWCRVTRGHSDGRILATMWPLYVLHSHLPLDTDVLIATEIQTSSVELTTSQSQPQPLKPPILQMTPGRGTSTHLQVLGTTSARHSLSFQYRHLECPVTREAIPMHYGVTDTSVFDKRSPVTNIDDVIKDIQKWLERSGRHATKSWPYSVVRKHWQSEWQPAPSQPRCDVIIRYTAVRAGGGCSLEVQLCPMVMLCNASPVSMTLRSVDAAPLCKLKPGMAVSPPTAILEKPFFMSIELGRETFVSSRLQLSTEEPGRYGTLPPGHVALDHAANFAILCHQKVALLTLYYEIKEQINVLGVSTSYALINRLDTAILVSAIVVPDELEDSTTLSPKTFEEVPPHKDCSSSACGTQLCKFWLHGRWPGGDPAELRVYLCLALPESLSPSRLAVPIRLGQPPFRSALALIDSKVKSIPVVVTQMRQDGRWLVVVAPDPCPQFVVQNHTCLTLTVAQPIHSPNEASSSRIEATTECAGIKWWRMVPPKTEVHYSTPAHCARFPPEGVPPASMASPILTFARVKDKTKLEWSAPVVAADGEQLIQYYGGVTIKLRVRTHPHSTLLELQDVDQNDISASDIRRRLQGAFSKDNLVRFETGAELERTAATYELRSEANATPIQAKHDFPSEQLCREKTDITIASVHEQLPDKEMTPENYKIVKNTLISDVYGGAETTSAILKSASSAYRFTSESAFRDVYIDPDLNDLDESWTESERFRCIIASVAVELAATADVPPLLALHLDRTALLVTADNKTTKTILSIADAQIDNLQYDSGQYDFAVVASTRAAPLEADRWPPLWNMFAERETFAARSSSARLLLKLTHDKWEVANNKYNELTELEIRVGILALYIEDAYVKALVDLSRLVMSSNCPDTSLSEERSMQCPLRLRLLHVHPLDLTLTLHTAVRMYIALDQSPLRLSAFKLHDMMTSAERLTHALTVHYLSAAILGAGWVVGGLELLGAPGALAARLGGATGGVRGVASAAAAALLRSLSAWAGSLARNLDLLAGDEEHARRAAAARRRPPPSFVAGLVAGITNFAINILGAVGGLAHHPLVGVAVGETESGAAALRRGLLGALTKPLSATADLVAYAGSGLLRQTGWDPVPEPRCLRSAIEARTTAGWHRDCVRWVFRLCELSTMAGYEVLLDHAHLQLLLTKKFLVLAEPESERIVEMIDYRYCTLSPYEGQIVQLVVMQTKLANVVEPRLADEDDEYQISAAAMARVARYTGAQGTAQGSGEKEARVLTLLPSPGRSHALHSALAAALHHTSDSHFPML